MGKGRLEAFSDGVLAIIITIMVLEIKVPHVADIGAIVPILPVFFSYVLSFSYIGIYWNNHHHLLAATKHVNGTVLWANLHLLFWLSLIPFSSGWMGENHFAKWPVIIYGFNLIFCAIAYTLLTRALIKLHGKSSTLATAIGSDAKGNFSLLIYFCGIISSFIHPMLGFGLYVIVACIWFIPDRRIENKVDAEQHLHPDN